MDRTLQRNRYPGHRAWRFCLASLIPSIVIACPQAAPPGIEPRPVPDIPVAHDIEGLDPVTLRRQISRAEGRISDLAKTRDAALAGLDAAIAQAEAQASVAAAAAGVRESDAPAGGQRGSMQAEPARASTPLLEPQIQAARRRAIRDRYADMLAEAGRLLARLLARQARIDPDAPDQERLRGMATVGVPAPQVPR